MKRALEIALAALLAAAAPLSARAVRVPPGCDPSAMSDGYWRLWNDGVQREIDAAIASNRMASGSFAVDAADGTEVRVEQLSHDFRFGAHSLKLGRQRTPEANRRYEDLFCRLFNQVTVVFCWRAFEIFPYDGHFAPRVPQDLEAYRTSPLCDGGDGVSRYWNTATLSTDQVVAFAKSRNLSLHGHPLVWGDDEWMVPYWVYDQYCPLSEKLFLRLPRRNPRDFVSGYSGSGFLKATRERWREIFANYPRDEIAAACPRYIAALDEIFARRIDEILGRYGDRFDSWDVVNESSEDWAGDGRAAKTANAFTESIHGILPADYARRSLERASARVAPGVRLALNDWNVTGGDYTNQVADLLGCGSRIDMLGAQFHVFRDEDFERIVAGGDFKAIASPDGVKRLFARLGSFGRPVHLSEITIPAPGDTDLSRQRQAIVAYNLYRAWFAEKSCCAITWWHTCDWVGKGGGVENGRAGVLDENLNPKPVFNALDRLINDEWKTRLTLGASSGRVAFRGFRGEYRLSWRDGDGRTREKFVTLR